MKKLLTFGAWIVGIALAVGAIIFVARKQHTARDKAEAARQKDCAALAITFDQKYSCAKEAQSRHDYLPWWYVLAAWPDGVFGIVLYRNLLDLSQTKPHETRWIYLYNPPRGEFGDSVTSAGGLGISHKYDNYS